MRDLLMIAAIVLGVATPAAANWGYDNGGANAAASYGYASYGAANYGYGGGYANLSQYGATLPSWGDCPCCAGAWAGYCEERAARAAKRHCNSCGNSCGHRHFGRKCGAKGCDTCGGNGDCGCAGGEATMESAPTTEQPLAPPPPTPDAAPATSAAAAPAGRSAHLLPSLAWLLSLTLAR